MQVRILDHARLLGAIHLPPEARGQAVVAIRESEGHVSKLQIEIGDGRLRRRQPRRRQRSSAAMSFGQRWPWGICPPPVRPNWGCLALTHRVRYRSWMRSCRAGPLYPGTLLVRIP